MSKLVLPLHRVLETSISCHSEHREESQFAFFMEMFRCAQHDILRN